MPVVTDSFTLSNGVTIPKIGFGTWQIPNGKSAYSSVTEALRVGYRHIDTARAYGNEASVGKAIRDSGIPRTEIFVTTKLPAEIKNYKKAHKSFHTTLSTLDLDYVDLYLIHAPWPWSDQGSDHQAGNIEAWRAMEEIYKSGRTRAIGVSNFSATDIDSLMTGSTVLPHANQIRWFVGNTQPGTTQYCLSNGILVEGYSPLATGAIVNDAHLEAIAAKYGRSVAQLCIRYLLQKDVLPLPKTTTPSRITENTQVDFEISAPDVALLDNLHRIAE